MPIRNLRKIFRPDSVAVVGANNDAGTPGCLAMRNLLENGFDGPIMPVTADERAVAGVLTYPDVAALPMVPDLALVAWPTAATPAAIRALGEKGTRAAILLGHDPFRPSDPGNTARHEALREEARPFGLRLLGPSSLGVIVPSQHLNASLSHIGAARGKIAFVSQSGAICRAIIDWAGAHGIGFSHFVSLGETADIDFGDIIDYLGSDPETRAILLYIQSIGHRRNFMSAGRGAGRNKPILVIKAGRVPGVNGSATPAAGMLASADDVYDAAFRRAGMLRVFNFGELFAAVETLARARPLKGERLAIVCNGSGPPIMAVDGLLLNDGRLAHLSDTTVSQLDADLPAQWSRGNPVDIGADAAPEHYALAVRTVLKSREADAVLVLHTPTPAASTTDCARAVIAAAEETGGNVLTSWMGEYNAAEARHLFAEAGVPTYPTPTRAVAAFLHLVRYRRNQDMLIQTPPSKPSEFTPASDAARLVVERVLDEGRSTLSDPEVKAVLTAFGIPMVKTEVASTPDEAVMQAEKIGFPVALKVLSPDIDRKAEVGGVDLFLDSPEAVRSAAESIRNGVALKAPGARLSGFTVQAMALRPGSEEVFAGVFTDPIFGPVIAFGHGGRAVDVIGDRAVALPPLNLSLAREMISRTRIARLLAGYRDRPAANISALCLTLAQISQMIVELPEIVELDINPLLADDKGVLAVDARIRVQRVAGPADRRMAIRPYPKELEEDFVLASGQRALLRPIRPEDEPAHYEFLSRVTPEDIRMRFFGIIGPMPHTEMARLTQIDYDREMAFVATAPAEDGDHWETLGVVRTVSDLERETAEYAILVRSDLKGQRLGWKLMDKIIHYCRTQGLRRIVGQVLRENHRMIDMVKGLGFQVHAIPDEDVVEVSLDL